MYINIWDSDTYEACLAENRRRADAAERASIRNSERARAERAAENAAWDSILPLL